MTASNAMHRLIDLFRLCVEIALLPVAKLQFRTQAGAASIRAVYEYFTKPHPKYKVFGNKALGAALIDLRAFRTVDEFTDSLRRYGRGQGERNRALARGYQVGEIDRNALVDEIHRINVSSPVRQGRPMDPAYVEKQLHFEDQVHYRYYGVFDRQQQLVAYCNLGILGNFAITDRLLGVRNSDGAMYLLVTEIACILIAERQLEYLMYDTIFGTKPGLRDFKRRLGFQPYRVRYSIDSKQA